MHLKAVRALLAASILTVGAVASAAPWVRTWEATPVEIPTARPGHRIVPMADVTFRTTARGSAGPTRAMPAKGRARAPTRAG